MYGAKYLATSKYGTENLKHHIDSCPRRSLQDIGQLMLVQNSGSMSVSASKFDANKYRDILIGCVVKHEMPFQFAEYSSVRSLL